MNKTEMFKSLQKEAGLTNKQTAGALGLSEAMVEFFRSGRNEPKLHYLAVLLSCQARGWKTTLDESAREVEQKQQNPLTLHNH